MRRIGITLLILIPASILLSWLTWFLSPAQRFDLLIIDKTVVNEQANKQRGLTWLLEQERYLPTSGEYEPGEMSIGFKPTGEGRYEITGFETKDSAECVRLASAYDGAYIADAYGIFETSWYQEYPELGPVTRPTRKIYGGLHRNDITVLRTLEKQNKLIIAEFSSLGPPTPPDVRKELESILGVHWTGWTGRFFETLDSTGNDLPNWIVTNFMRQSGGSWPFEDAPGIVISHVDERIVVLRYPQDLERLSPEIAVTFDQRARFDAPANPLPYPYWFDIVQPDTNAETIAYFSLPTKETADTLLNAFGIPRIFPAVTERTDNKRIYYFAGDFADYPPVNELLAHFKWMKNIRTTLYSIDDPASRAEFYWTMYYPMVRSILSSSIPKQ